MNLPVQIVLFFLGMGLCVQWVGALFGLVDCRYDRDRLYPQVTGRIALWTGIIAMAALLLGPSLRPAFLWGVAVFPLFHVAAYFGGKALMALKVRS